MSTTRKRLRASACQPSRTCAHDEVVPSPRSTRPTTCGSRRVTAAASAEVAAVIHRTVEPSKSAISTPAAAGPARSAIAPSASRRPTRRSTLTPPCRATAGSSASRAVMPGTSPKEPSAPNRTNQPTPSPVTRSTIGSAAIDAADTRSVTTDAVRRLTRSITTPMNSPASTAGTAVAAATAPADSGLPVVCRTISGRAIAGDGVAQQGDQVRRQVGGRDQAHAVQQKP